MYCSLIEKDEMEDVYRFICYGLSKDWEVKEIDLPFDIDLHSFASDNYIEKMEQNKNGYHCTVHINPRTRHKYLYLFDITLR